MCVLTRQEGFHSHAKDGSSNFMKILLQGLDPDCVQDCYLALVKLVWIYTRLNCNSDGSLLDTDLDTVKSALLLQNSVHKPTTRAYCNFQIFSPAQI